MKQYQKSLFLLCLVSVSFCFSGCEQTDDVAGIFTNKTWKLTMIYRDGDGSKPALAADYWGGDEEARDQSISKLEKEGTFTITFEGLESDGVIKGTYTGFVTNASISANWEANGKTNAFTTTQGDKSDNDALGRAFINALKNAYRYEGDYNNLSIYFKEGAQKKYLLFRKEK